jgi:hypothetical protein
LQNQDLIFFPSLGAPEQQEGAAAALAALLAGASAIQELNRVGE